MRLNSYKLKVTLIPRGHRKYEQRKAGHERLAKGILSKAHWSEVETILGIPGSPITLTRYDSWGLQQNLATDQRVDPPLRRGDVNWKVLKWFQRKGLCPLWARLIQRHEYEQRLIIIFTWLYLKQERNEREFYSWFNVPFCNMFVNHSDPMFSAKPVTLEVEDF